MSTERVVNDRFGLEAGAMVFIGSERRRAVRRVIQKMRVPERGVWDQLNIAAGRNLFEPVGVTKLCAEPVHLLGDIRPERRLIIRGDETAQADPPGLHVFRPEAQTLERNGHAGYEASGSDTAFGIPKGVETIV